MTSAEDARTQLSYFRHTLAEIGQDHNVGIVAAGTHPLARCYEQRVTPKRRYANVIKDLQMVGIAHPLCGLHVHVEVPEPEQRIQLMCRVIPYLHVLLALSTSSPFWEGHDTGLLGYRNAVGDMLPRSGVPSTFESAAEYEDYINALQRADIIPNASFIWWFVRPSRAHPTLELRIMDSCTSVEDAVAIASLYRAIVRHLIRHPEVNSNTTALACSLQQENRWRAQRYGTQGTFFCEDGTDALPFRQILGRLTERLQDDITALGIQREIAHLLKIPARGTSAHLQRRLLNRLRREGLERGSASRAVARWLMESTHVGSLIRRPPRRGEVRSRRARAMDFLSDSHAPEPARAS